MISASSLPDRLRRGLRKHLWAYLFVAPMFALFLVFTLYPLAASGVNTLYDWDGIGKPAEFIGLGNYITIAADPYFWNAFKNSFLYTLAVVPVQLTLALVLAVCLNSPWLKARSLFRFIFFSPIVTSSAIVGVVISLSITTVGDSLNTFLLQLGWIQRPLDWLGNPQLVMWVIIAVGVWIGLGYPLIYFLAALQSIEPELYDAAKMDGAGAFNLFRYITVPLIRPVGLVVLLITTLHSLRVFDIVQAMTRGGPFFASDVVGTYIYRQAFYMTSSGDNAGQVGYASAAAFFMGLLVMGVSLLQLAAVRSAARQRNLRRLG
jgi:ABC-type sugar transport system permease subunit